MATRERCSQALARVRERIATQGPDNRHVLALLQQMAAPPRYLARVALRSGGKISFVNLEDILYMQAAENYVQLHLKNSRHLLHVPIATLESSLDPQVFLRIHRSLIVNVKHIRELETGPHGEYIVVLHGGTRLQSPAPRQSASACGARPSACSSAAFKSCSGVEYGKRSSVSSTAARASSRRSRGRDAAMRSDKNPGAQTGAAK